MIATELEQAIYDKYGGSPLTVSMLAGAIVELVDTDDYYDAVLAIVPARKGEAQPFGEKFEVRVQEAWGFTPDPFEYMEVL